MMMMLQGVISLWPVTLSAQAIPFNEKFATMWIVAIITRYALLKHFALQE